MNYTNHSKVLIEKYRNFEIYFDTDKETFYSVSDYYDTETSKKTYAATKTAIDAFIKENSTFRPFNVVKVENGWMGNRYPTSHDNVTTITGKRKDGRFTAGTVQVSDFDAEHYYFLALPENEPVFVEMKPILEEIEELKQAIKNREKEVEELSKKLKLTTLKEHKKNSFS